MEVGEVGLTTALGRAVRPENTYTYSVRDPRSDRERYMRAAPMDLRPPSQNRLALGKDGAEITNKMAARST
jgi:hypothetical protein